MTCAAVTTIVWPLYLNAVPVPIEMLSSGPIDKIRTVAFLDLAIKLVVVFTTCNVGASSVVLQTSIEGCVHDSAKKDIIPHNMYLIKLPPYKYIGGFCLKGTMYQVLAGFEIGVLLFKCLFNSFEKLSY